ncbi:MAG: 30S ribosomal protein S12 methylthiotransferase RimO [Acidobacteria bacterium]|nr:30S ribosomal protein S12 methylthiotransferase RimO [Acidobacteriota bacterium]
MKPAARFPGPAPKVGLVSLGCAKNLLDSEVMAGVLTSRGFEMTADPADADALVVNTCGFIGPAKEEGINTILELARLKSHGRCRRLVVAGCLAQRYASELAREIPEIDAVIGLDEVERIADVLIASERRTPPLRADQSVTWLYDHTTPRIRSTPPHIAYIKVAEGCDYPCSFCVIPQIRGRFRSRDPDSVLAEAASLAATGTRELVLVAQDTTAYGKDLGIRNGLARLLRELAAVDGIGWVRFLYAYPTTLDDEVLSAMAEVPEVCRYVDIPLQHANRRVLRDMRRPGNRESNERLLARIRGAVPGVAIRSTFIVGFPGETEDEFRELFDFVEAARFDAMGAFVYSNEESATSHVEEEVISESRKEDRRARLMELQQGIALARHREMVGSVVPVLVDGAAEESELLTAGRTEKQAPDVDARVLIVDGDAPAGEFVDVEITGAHPEDLVGKALGAPALPAGPVLPGIRGENRKHAPPA